MRIRNTFIYVAHAYIHCSEVKVKNKVYNVYTWINKYMGSVLGKSSLEIFLSKLRFLLFFNF